MGRFFNPDNFVFSSLSKLVDIVFLSILWAIFSIPIFTIGASTSALYYTANKTLRHNRDYVWRSFWTGFKSSFKQSTLAWVIYCIFMVLMYADYRLIGQLLSGGTARTLMIGFFMAMMVLGSILMLYVLPYISRFSLDLKNIIKNCGFLASRHFWWSILMLVLTVVLGYLTMLIPLALFFAPSIWGLLATLMLESVFKKYMSDEDRAMEEMKNDKHPRN